MNAAMNSIVRINGVAARRALTPLVGMYSEVDCYLATIFITLSNCDLFFSVSDRGVARHTSKWLKAVNERRKKYEEKYKDKLAHVQRRSNFVDWNLNAEVYAFGKRLNEDFRIELLLQAFIHR